MRWVSFSLTLRKWPSTFFRFWRSSAIVSALILLNWVYQSGLHQWSKWFAPTVKVVCTNGQSGLHQWSKWFVPMVKVVCTNGQSGLYQCSKWFAPMAKAEFWHAETPGLWRSLGRYPLCSPLNLALPMISLKVILLFVFLTGVSFNQNEQIFNNLCLLTWTRVWTEMHVWLSETRRIFIRSCELTQVAPQWNGWRPGSALLDSNLTSLTIYVVT